MSHIWDNPHVGGPTDSWPNVRFGTDSKHRVNPMGVSASNCPLSISINPRDFMVKPLQFTHVIMIVNIRYTR